MSAPGQGKINYSTKNAQGQPSREDCFLDNEVADKYYEELRKHRDPSNSSSSSSTTKPKPNLQRTKQRRVAQEELANFLSNFAWEWWLTATFKGEFTPEAGRRAIQRYFKELEKRLQTPIPRFWCQEYGMIIEYGPHYHALLGRVNHVKNSAQIAHSLWIKHRGHGLFETQSYQEERGANYYLTKYVTKDSFQAGDWGLDILDKL